MNQEITQEMNKSNLFDTVRRDYEALSTIPEELLTYEICQYAVTCCHLALDFVPEKFFNDELYKVVVTYNSALQFIPEEKITLELCEIAVEKDGSQLKYVPYEFITKKLCKLAVNNDGYALEYVPEEFISEKLYYDAVINYRGTLQFVSKDFRTEKLCSIAIICDDALQFVPEIFKTKKICQIAIINNFTAINYVPKELFDELLKFTISQHKNVLKYLDEFLTEELCIYAINKLDYNMHQIPNKYLYLFEN